MYYPDEIVEQVRASNDIVDVVGQYVKLKKQGANYFGLCPFHNEKSPSFSVSPSKQIFYCFGCGAGGNVITFLMKYENYSFQEALKALAERGGVALPQMEYSAQMRAQIERRNQLFAVNKEAATYYYHLLRSPRGAAGMRYLTERKLTPQTMSHFGLGYADGSNSDLVRYLRGKGFADDVILESGVAAHDEKRGLHDKFWNRVIYPIMDAENRVIGFGGRVMGDGKPKYLNSPETPIFDKGRNLYGLNFARRSRKNQFILCEGYMDVISMHQAGFTQAVASLGTSFTTGQAQILKRYAKDIILSYDSDEAGVKAALRNNQVLRQAGLRARVLNLKPHKDPDEFIKAEGAEAFQQRLDEAENVFFFELRQAEKRYHMQDPSEKTDFCREAARMLGQFPDEMERENYLRTVAQQYFIDEEALRRMVGAYAQVEDGLGDIPIPDRPAPAGRTAKSAPDADVSLPSQRYLLTWLADEPELIPQVARYLTPADFSEGVCRIAAERFWASPGTASEPAQIIGLFTEEAEQQEAAALFHAELTLPDGREEREKALRDIVYAVKKGSVEREEKAEAGSPDALKNIIRNKKSLENLRKVHFSVRGA